MPMPESFKKRLFPLIPRIARDFRPLLAGETSYPLFSSEKNWALSPGFHIYDEMGIRETINRMQKLIFEPNPGKNFFAVKACPNLAILRLVLENGFGLDCASPTELYRAKLVGAKPHQIMYTSNNTNPLFFPYAREVGCILNLDDSSLASKLSPMPKRICFRYNPGERRTVGSNAIIGNPPNQKYGLRHSQIVDAFKEARQRGAKIFGLHMMFVSNCREAGVIASNAQTLLGVAEMIHQELGVLLEFINIGGGLGINYKPKELPLKLEAVAQMITETMEAFQKRWNYKPLLYMESGRYVTGPHGVLVGKVINTMSKYKSFIGVDFCDAADILRAPMYPAYHEVSVLTSDGKEKINGPQSQVSIVGPLCENMHMVSDRMLPVIEEGDFIVVHDTGAHGIAMKMNYNGWGCSQELLLHPDNSVERIGRAETIGDLLAREILLSENEAHRKTMQY